MAHIEEIRDEEVVTEEGMEEILTSEETPEPTEEKPKRTRKKAKEADEVELTNIEPIDDFDDVSVASELNDDSVIGLNDDLIEEEKKPRRRKDNTEKAREISLDVEIETAEQIEAKILHELKNSQVERKPVKVNLSGIERMDNGNLLVVTYYKTQRIVIPLSQMGIVVKPLANETAESAKLRQEKFLSKMVGAEIDIIINGIDKKDKSVIGSRAQAMMHKRRYYFIKDKQDPMGRMLIRPGRKVQARVIAVSARAVRVEVFGVETTINRENLAWTYISDPSKHYFVGATILVKVTSVEGDDPANLIVGASIKELTEDNSHQLLKQLKVGSVSVAKVDNINNGVMFLILEGSGVLAMAHDSHDSKRQPGIGDTVAVVIRSINEERKSASCVITKVIKRSVV